MAKKLDEGIRTIRQISVVHPVQTNSVFATIPEPVVEQMYQRGWKFYTHVGSQGEARLMCSWDTTPEDVSEFVGDLKECAAGAKQPV